MRTYLFTTICLALLSGCQGEQEAAQGSSGGTPGAETGKSSTGAVSGAGAGPTATGGKGTTGGSPATGGSMPATGSKTGGGTGGGGTGSGATGSGATTGGGGTGGAPTGGGGAPTGGKGGAGGSGGTTTGGTGGTGATGATGGAPPSGGSGPVVISKCNLPVAGTAGQAKPAGAAGGLKVLDWAGFKGAVSFTFDDGNSSLISNYEKLHATGARSTYFLVSSWAGGKNDVWKTAVKNGDELGNHTNSHNDNASSADLKTAQDFLKSNYGVTGYTMAAPNGTDAWATPAKDFFIANRDVGGGAISPRDNTNVFQLPSYLPSGSSESAATMGGKITAGKWVIFCVHGFVGDNNAYQAVDLNAMTSAMSKSVSDGYWADTMMNVTAYYLGQKLIPTTASTSATWTLPANFPPNMCLRVTTTGGTVKQKGAEVPWNDHGYYEISLDALSVTVE